ncbi:hypothetical protein LSTR_LSTR005484 [Laodelphax striatellus]|uniref:Tetraspanin n=1 Tax=Laodelphax striatellus TaxID=195883 RepID=A0A482WXA1_LAOST|nr:hypothetical protein LSTR_LSTR005484 [Laodelphax striatellus]
MSLDFGSWCAKYILCLFNFVFFLCGGAVLSVGIWLKLDQKSFIAITKIAENRDVPEFQQFSQPVVISQLAYILIVVGAVIFIVSFMGYCGALQESRCLLTTYGILLLTILLIEVVAVGVALACKGKAEAETKTFLKSTVKDYYSTNDKADVVTVTWNILMAQMSCCGVDDYKDFQTSEKFKEGNMTVPVACCVLEGDFRRFSPRDPNCPYSPSEANSYYKTGCYKTMVNWVLDHINWVIWVMVGVVLAELIVMCFAFCLSKSLESYK